MRETDPIAGGFDADALFGQAGDDMIIDSALPDFVFDDGRDDVATGGLGMRSPARRR